MTVNEPTAAERAAQEARERHRAWLASLRRCSCLRPVPGRLYLGRSMCAKCGKLRV